MTTSRQRLKQRVLKKRGLTKDKGGHLAPHTPGPLRPDPTGRKFLSMRLMEDRFGVSLEELLDGKRGWELAILLGVSEATISRWRKRLGLEPWNQ